MSFNFMAAVTIRSDFGLGLKKFVYIFFTHSCEQSVGKKDLKRENTRESW